MKLVLHVSNPEILMQNQTAEHTFSESGGSIGRNPLSDWVICDTRRFISGKHAEISFTNGRFYLTDCSTNGVYLNSSDEAVGNGNSIPLNDNDQLLLGELKITASLNTPESSVSLSGNHDDTDIFADLLGGITPEVQTEVPMDIISSAPELDELIGATDSSGINFNHDEVIDPLALLDGDAGTANSPYDAIINSGMPADKIENRIPNTAMDFAFEPPQVSQEAATGNQIPDNWDFLGAEIKPEPQAVAPANETHIEGDDLLALISGEEALATTPVASAPARVAATQAVTADSTLDTILSDAGLNPTAYTHEQKQNFVPLIGSMLRSCLDGLVTALMARNQVKSGLRMAVTTIAPVENNPLKFSISGDEALRNLLAAREGYLPPGEAIREGFQDLQIHQLAMMSATQKTLQELVARFSPDKLSQEFDNAKGNGIKIGTKKMHYWDSYEAFHHHMEQAIADDFQNLLGDIFADAYEEQTQMAKKQR